MSIEIVTGKSGSPHVSSADDGRRIAGTVGAENYVLQTGGRLAPSLVDANTVSIATGDAILQGRHFACESPSEVKIANGSQGRKRIDYICVRYRRDVDPPDGQTEASLIETPEWTVLQGTPAESSPQPPAVPDGSILDGDADVTIPVARVDLDGLTVAAPKLLLEELHTVGELWDSVSRAARIRQKVGSKVVDPGGADYAYLLTQAELKSMLGFDPAAGDVLFASVVNGDWSAAEVVPVGCSQHANQLLVQLNKARSGATRLNYIVGCYR